MLITVRDVELYRSQYEIFQERLLDPELRSMIHPNFYHYCNFVFLNADGLEEYFSRTIGLAKVLDIKGKELLDIGCGYGLQSLIFSLIGCESIIGYDMNQGFINNLKVLLKVFPECGNIQVEHADCLKMDFKKESCDILMLHNALSHINHTESLLDKLISVVRPNGKIAIIDDNNALNIISRMISRKKHKRAEYGPFEDPEGLLESPEYNAPYSVSRKRIIRQLRPDIDEETLETLTKKTQGLYGEQIKMAVDEFLATRKITCKASFPYTNPYNGEVCEYPINPLRLKCQFENRGFDCRLIPPFYRIRSDGRYIDKIKNFIKRVLSNSYELCPQSLLPFFDRGVFIVAKKQA